MTGYNSKCNSEIMCLPHLTYVVASSDCEMQLTLAQPILASYVSTVHMIHVSFEVQQD